MVTNDRTKDIGQTRGAGGERRIPADRIVPSINNDSTLNMLYSRRGQFGIPSIFLRIFIVVIL